MKLLPFEYAVRNLGRSRRRLVLTVAGAALVLLLLLVAAGFVRGFSRSMAATGGAHNVILLGAGSEDSVERSEVGAGVAGVVSASLPGIRTRAGVPFVSPEVHVMLPVGGVESAPERVWRDRVTASADAPFAHAASAPPSHADDAERGRQVYVRGVTPAATLVHDSVALIEGRWPRTAADEILIGRLAPAVIGTPRVHLGERIRIDGRDWTVVGRFAAPGTAVESEVWMPLQDLLAATRRDTLSCVVVTLEPYDEATGEGAEFADVDAFVRMRPDLELAALPEREYYRRLSAFFGPIRTVTMVTAGLIALAGLLGGLNTTYAAFAARIREMGTLQALGFARTALAISLVQESTLATAAGGLIACAAGALLIDGLAVRFSMGAFGLVIDGPVVAAGLLAGLALGVIGSLPPAIRCLRPSIPEALKAV
jgi:putative ABC transport system permease protein